MRRLLVVVVVVVVVVVLLRLQLMGDFLLRFGEHFGQRVRAVPREHLEFLCDWAPHWNEDARRIVLSPRCGTEELVPLADRAGEYVSACCAATGLAHLAIAQPQYYDQLREKLGDGKIDGGVRAAAAHVAACRDQWQAYERETAREDSPCTPRVLLWAHHQDAINAARSYVNAARLCRACYKKMPPVGSARVNGRQWHGDWSTRELHKQCFVRCVRAAEDAKREEANKRALRERKERERYERHMSRRTIPRADHAAGAAGPV